MAPTARAGGIILSKEPGNLYNKHSYKYSGLQACAIARPCAPEHASHCSHSVPAAGICIVSTLRIKQPCLMRPKMPMTQASATTRPYSWSSLAACTILALHHGHAVSAAGLCTNRTLHVRQSCHLHASIACCRHLSQQGCAHGAAALLFAFIHASHHDCAVPAAGSCNKQAVLMEQQPCCLHSFMPQIMTAVPAAGICNG